MAPDAPPTLLVLRALGLGDLLTGVPALRALAAAFPGHRRLLAAPAALEGLALLTGVVDAVVPVGPLAPLPSTLAGVAVAVNLHGRGPQSHRLLQALGPRRLVAFGCAKAAHAGPAWRAGEHEVKRWCRLLGESGVPADPARLELAAPPAEPADRGATIVHPGAARPARRWPPARFAAVARAERAAGRQVLVTGAAGERALAEEVARLARLPGGAVRAGRTDLVGLAALVGAAGRVVCGDTGVAHLATALGTPSVTLFGPTSPERWGPPPGRPRHRVIWRGRPGDPHADRPDAGLLAISVPEVLAELNALAVRATSPSR